LSQAQIQTQNHPTMKKLYSIFAVTFLLSLFTGMHRSFANENLPKETLPISRPKPVFKAPFKPLPFKTLLPNVELYEFNAKAYAFDKIVGLQPILVGKEWQTVTNDPIKFALTPNKQTAVLGEEIELTLTAELLDISPKLLFTLEELRNYSIKVILPQDFIQTGGTYLNFATGTLDPTNPKHTYTIKGRYLDKPAPDDCFKVLRKLNDDVFVLKSTICLQVKGIDIALKVGSDSSDNNRIATTNYDDLKFMTFGSFTDWTSNIAKVYSSNANHYLRCYGGEAYIYYVNFNFYYAETSNFPVGSVKIDIYLGNQLQTSKIITNLVNGAETINKVGPGVFKGVFTVYSSTNGSGTPIATREIIINAINDPCPTNTPNTLSISTNETSLCPGASTTLTAMTNCTAASISWQKDGAAYGTNGVTTSVSTSGTYKAVCNSPAMVSNTIAVSVSNTPTVPNIKTNRNSITPGEFATLTATNCQGTVVWQGPNNFTDIGDEISVGQPGNYQALCRSNCNGTVYYSDLSGIIGISLLPLRLEADKYEKYSNETAQISAYGCNNGYISWKVNGAAIPQSDNPLTAYSAGTYSAQCTSFNGPSSDWVVLYISEKTSNTPFVTASKTHAFPTDNVTLNASGCPSGWYYKWEIPVTANDNSVTIQRPVGTPQIVNGPGTYKVQCILNDQNQSAYTSVTVNPLNIGDVIINITANKTEANIGEPVVFTVTGNCPNGGGIRWMINGMNYWSYVGETFTGTGPGTYAARCESGPQISPTVYYTVKPPKPGGISIVSDKTRAKDNELVTLRAIGCDNEVTWTLPDNTEVRGSTILFNFGPGLYKAKCVNKFGFTSEPASLTIATRNWNEPSLIQTNTSIAANQLGEMQIQGCPNDWVQWAIPRKDANGNEVKDANGQTVYDYTGGKILIFKGPGIYKVRCSTGDYSYNFQNIVVQAAPTNSLFLKANRNVAKPDESVTITAYGCPNGTVTWKNGNQTATGTQITVTGPGVRMAKCTGDYSNNGDWALAQIRNDGNITPYLNASVYEACPDQPVNITASGCPNGWWYQTRWIKPGQLDYWLANRNAPVWEVYNYGGSNETKNGPNLYSARCISPDGSWMGDFDEKSITVEPAFPNDLRATNNGPVLMGATSVKLAVTEVPSATYAWAGPNAFVSGVRSPEILTPTEAQTGIYTVTLNKGVGQPWACNATATTKLTVSGCDIRIKASNATTGVESYVLPYSTNPNRAFGDLGLEVISPSGMVLSNMNFVWTKPDGTTASSQQLVVDTKGIYRVKVTVPNTTIGCAATVSITEPGTRYMLWEKARDLTMSNGTIPVKVVPLKYEGKADRTIFFGEGGLPTSTDNFSAEQYKTKSYLMLYSVNSSTKSEVLRVIPDFNYAKTHSSWNQADFSGRMMMYDYTEKNFLGGWKYTNGVPVKRIYEYETTGERPLNDDCVVMTSKLKEPDNGAAGVSGSGECITGMGCGWKETGNSVYDGDKVYIQYYKPCETSTIPNTGSNATPPAPDYGTLGWFFNTPTYTTQPLVNVLPGDLRGVLGVNPSSTAFKQKMSGYIAGFFIEASSVDPKVIIKNTDAVSRQRFKLYVYLLIDELKKALLQSDDPNVRAYANSLRYPDDATIDACFDAYAPEDGSSWNPFNNPYQAATMIVNGFLDSLPIDVYREEKIDAVTKALTEKVKNAYNALVPILNSCTEGVATGQTSYCTAQAALVMEIRNILISQGKDVSNSLFAFENILVADATTISNIWSGIGGNPTNPNPTYQGYTITYKIIDNSPTLKFQKGADIITITNLTVPNGIVDDSPSNNVPDWVRTLSYKERIKPLASEGLQKEGNVPVRFSDGRTGNAYSPNGSGASSFYIQDTQNDVEYFKIDGHYIFRKYDNDGKEILYYLDENDNKWHKFVPFDYPASMSEVMKIYGPSLLVFADKTERIFLATTIGLITLPISGSTYILYTAIGAFGVTFLTEALREELKGTAYLEAYDTVSWLLMAYQAGAFIGKGTQYLVKNLPILETNIRKIELGIRNSTIPPKFKAVFKQLIEAVETLRTQTKGNANNKGLTSSYGQPLSEIGEVIQAADGTVIVKGKFSNRPFNPNNSGGSILNLDWNNATIEQAGINDIQTHLARLAHDTWNDRMIERLIKIKNGTIPVTDFDKKFYTHELRELQRCRNLGFSDTRQLSYEEWDSVHSATLEDYKINEAMDYLGQKISSLFHPDVQIE